MKLRRDFLDNHIICETLVGKYNYSGNQLICYTNVTTKEVYFLVMWKEKNYTSKRYDTIEDAICDWNTAKDLVA